MGDYWRHIVLFMDLVSNPLGVRRGVLPIFLWIIKGSLQLVVSSASIGKMRNEVSYYLLSGIRGTVNYLLINVLLNKE